VLCAEDFELHLLCPRIGCPFIFWNSECTMDKMAYPNLGETYCPYDYTYGVPVIHIETKFETF
jgi:hypothetical protein